MNVHVVEHLKTFSFYSVQLFFICPKFSKNVRTKLKLRVEDTDAGVFSSSIGSIGLSETRFKERLAVVLSFRGGSEFSTSVFSSSWQAIATSSNFCSS